MQPKKNLRSKDTNVLFPEFCEYFSLSPAHDNDENFACLTRMTVCKLLKNGGQGRNRTADASLFSLSASCICNDLTGFRWLPKSLIGRQRHSNRGLESWAE